MKLDKIGIAFVRAQTLRDLAKEKRRNKLREQNKLWKGFNNGK